MHLAWHDLGQRDFVKITNEKCVLIPPQNFSPTGFAMSNYTSLENNKYCWVLHKTFITQVCFDYSYYILGFILMLAQYLALVIPIFTSGCWDRSGNIRSHCGTTISLHWNNLDDVGWFDKMTGHFQVMSFSVRLSLWGTIKRIENLNHRISFK